MSWKYWGATLVAAITITIGLAGSSYGGSWQPDDVKVKILVPVVEIEPNHYFQDSKKFTELEWPRSRLRESMEEVITSFDQIKGKTSRNYKLRLNEPIYKNDLGDFSDSERLVPGEVAHSLRLPPDRAPTGFIKVGDRVDVTATIQPDVAGELIKTRFILEDIEVLAIELEQSKNPTDAEKGRNYLVLRLTRPQSLVLKYFVDVAKVDVVRRKPGDTIRVTEDFYFSNEKMSWGNKLGATPEQKVLDMWLGRWRSTYMQPKTEGAAEEKSGTAELSISRVVGGQFVRENSEHSDNTTGSVTSTYLILFVQV